MSRRENDFDSCENNEFGGKLFGNQKYYFGSWADYVGMLELLGFRMIFAGGKIELPAARCQKLGEHSFSLLQCQGYRSR